MALPFQARQLSRRVWVIVENDRFGESPHIYGIVGQDKVVVVDSGCASGDLRVFLRGLPGMEELPFLVVNTHVHYDHIMGNHCFCRGGDALREDCLGICQGARDVDFSQRWRETSLQSSVGAKIQPFCVSSWLAEGDCIPLDAPLGAEDSEDGLEVIYTPGHTPDSISLYLPSEGRLFTGDLVYPGPLYLFLPGSSLPDFHDSVTRLVRRWGEGEQDEQEEPAAAQPSLCCGHNSAELPFGALHELTAAFARGLGEGQPARISWFEGELRSFRTPTFRLLCRAEDVDGAAASKRVRLAEPAADITT